jgi:ubiquinone/menaquinone biosynthesis C-methylase UbiE
MTDQSVYRSAPWGERRRMFVLTGAVLAALVAVVLLLAGRSRGAEVHQLTELLSLREGMTVGEIGAGRGWLTVEVARRVGPSGGVYSTELSAARLDDIRQAVAEDGLTNVTVLEAGERATNLPAGCCEVIFMRRVYHHLSEPPAILASIHEALKPGGRLIIIEFRRAGVVGSVTRMGIDRAKLTEAVTAAGFDVVITREWPGWDHYVAVFVKSGRLSLPPA